MPQTRPDTSDRPSNLPWPPILLVLVIVGAVVLGRVAALQWPGLDDSAAHYIGLGLGALGVVLAIAAIVTLRMAGTTVRPHTGAPALVTTGPYRRFRNPL